MRCGIAISVAITNDYPPPMLYRFGFDGRGELDDCYAISYSVVISDTHIVLDAVKVFEQAVGFFD